VASVGVIACQVEVVGVLTRISSREVSSMGEIMQKPALLTSPMNGREGLAWSNWAIWSTHCCMSSFKRTSQMIPWRAPPMLLALRIYSSSNSLPWFGSLGTSM